MSVSVFDLFKIGIGPSSSHTVGPMRAAALFMQALGAEHRLAECQRLQVELYGSLGATGKGHGSDKAVVAGLLGHHPDTVDPAWLAGCVEEVAGLGVLDLGDGLRPAFAPASDLVFNRKEQLPGHPNGMRCVALGAAGEVLLERVYYSVGGGFVVDESAVGADRVKTDDRRLPLAFMSGEELLERCEVHGLKVSDVMLRNETAWHEEAEIWQGLDRIWQVMQKCVASGLATEGTLPGGMRVKRRAASVYKNMSAHPESALSDPLNVMDWVNLYALAVSEENAAGGRVVTAPTNGAAGIIPAVMHYAHRFVRGTDDRAMARFLLTAAAIGLLYKENASISGADVGCQGEVGVACSMAAGALTELLGGTPQQVENAAEIGMEHNLGLTCDPVGGLVQVPCIERNAMGSIKAINAARIAMRGDGEHFVSLDKVIKTMRDTGKDMMTKYKETARGGLAVNVIEC